MITKNNWITKGSQVSLDLNQRQFQDSRISFKIQGSSSSFKIERFLPGLKDYFQDSRTSFKIQGSSSRTRGIFPRFKDFFQDSGIFFHIRGLLQDPRICFKIQGSSSKIQWVFFQDSMGLLPRFKSWQKTVQKYFM